MTDETRSLPYDLAAGGVVERRVGDATEIAVVARTRYGPGGQGDLALPKGHLESGESWQQAALREVEEETGCRCSIQGAPIPTTYMVNGAPKLVVFFPMRVLEQKEPTDANEVRAVEWLAPAKAFDRLSYASEKELVRKLYFSSVIGQILARVGERFRGNPPEASGERFDAQLAELQAELDAYSQAERALPWYGSARASLERARQLAESGESFGAWRLLKLARRTMLHSLTKAAKLREIHAERLKAEAAEKLVNWRKQALGQTLATAQGESPSVEQLIEAQALLDEHFDNLYYNLRLALQRLLVLPWLFLAALVVLLVKTAVAPEPAAAPESVTMLSSNARLAMVILMGVLGALLSLAMTARATSKRVTEELSEGNELFLRVMLGAASAVVVGIALEAGLVPIVDVKGMSLFVVAIAAGFTDRLLNAVLSGIESSAGK